MNKDVAVKWVKALRSGEYTQIGHTLQNSQGYCCLGVLCKIGGIDGVLINTLSGQIKGGALDDQPAIKEWAGMRTGSGKFKFKHQNNNLMALNDHEEYTFEQIADVIEKEWENL